jgi:hypothetical protein
VTLFEQCTGGKELTPHQAAIARRWLHAAAHELAREPDGVTLLDVEPDALRDRAAALLTEDIDFGPPRHDDTYKVMASVLNVLDPG